MYPCPDELVNLSVLKKYRDELDVLVGYSSHDKGVVIPAASIALGACMLEKHYTLDRTMIGPDHSASVEKEGLMKIVKYTKSVFAAMGSENKITEASEAAARIKYGVSIVSKKVLQKGEVLTEESITVKCPGGGISPASYWDLIGRKMTSDKLEDQIIYNDDIE